jgi:predicted ArsR family transcriptional regulator
MTGGPWENLEAIGVLEDPVRRSVYEVVAASGHPVSREQAAEGSGISRSLAAYHLDKLVAEGLLSVGHERRTGRSGPGAGRPAKVYERSDTEIAIAVPPRDYGLAAELLAEAATADESGHTRRALEQAAGRLGTEIGREAAEAGRPLDEVLRARGYEPYEEDGTTLMRNCPFHAVARRHPETVCGMNLALLEGVTAEMPVSVDAQLDPRPGRCCVALRATTARAPVRR